MPISYSNTLAAYAVGRRVNMEEWNTITRSLEGATALGFGQPAVAGTGAHTCVPLSATGQNILGVTEADPTLPRPGDTFAQYDNVPICESGVIGVLLGANVTKGAQARFDITNKVWTGAAASGTVLTIPGAQFDEAGSSGAVGKLRYRRPVPSVSA
ncbi:hypothetical protein ELI02_29950 (plasmid) [Rhizobium leguminosarum]|uniref:structural cement protein Gp24 n=1 Tax=Rhizobium leguminosarum TaxID=384 RepID=UPI00102FCEA2|nr:hypothetical protein [Rhizobium leguminosarum]TAX45940.1 hypothetical protein ELI02_29950 [Rhizobium leguminosarum]